MMLNCELYISGSFFPEQVDIDVDVAFHVNPTGALWS